MACSNRILLATLLCIVWFPFAFADGNLNDGYFDPSWAGGGHFTFAGDVANPNNPTTVTGITVESNGNLLLAGEDDVGIVDSWYIGELTPSGSFVQTFGPSDGSGRFAICSVFSCSSSALSNSVVGVVAEPPNTIAVLAQSSYAVLDFSGPIYSSFGNTFPVNNVQGSVDANGAMVQLPNGQLLLAGNGMYNSTTNTTSVFGIVRTSASFQLDSTFNQETDGNGVTFSGGNVIQIAPNEIDEQVRSILIQSDGKIVLTGFGTSNTQTTIEAARLNIDGTLDTSFGTNGKVQLPWSGGAIQSIGKAKLDRAGRIVVAATGVISGISLRGMLVARLSRDGVADSTFGDGGFSFNEYNSKCTSTTANDVAIDSAGRILAVGTCNQSNAQPFIVVRLRGDNGNVDACGINGYSLGSFGAASGNEADVVTFDSTARPIVAGNNVSNSVFQSGIARLTYDLIFTDNMEVFPAGCLAPNCN